MKLSEIDMYRDGGTITFRISDDVAAGLYRLQTPFLGEPRPLFRDGVQLGFGSDDECLVLNVLRAWLEEQLDPDTAAALADLDGLKTWLNLPERLNRGVPVRRIRDVIRCLEQRA